MSSYNLTSNVWAILFLHILTSPSVNCQINLYIKSQVLDDRSLLSLPAQVSHPRNRSYIPKSFCDELGNKEYNDTKKNAHI